MLPSKENQDYIPPPKKAGLEVTVDYLHDLQLDGMGVGTCLFPWELLKEDKTGMQACLVRWFMLP